MFHEHVVLIHKFDLFYCKDIPFFSTVLEKLNVVSLQYEMFELNPLTDIPGHASNNTNIAYEYQIRYQNNQNHIDNH